MKPFRNPEQKIKELQKNIQEIKTKKYSHILLKLWKIYYRWISAERDF